MQYDDTDIYSRVSQNGSYAIDAVQSVYVPVPTITAADGGSGITGDAQVHLGLWLPVIDGCDWSGTNLTEGCQIPVIAEVGPYYNDGDVDALTYEASVNSSENYVPGYSVARSRYLAPLVNHCG